MLLKRATLGGIVDGSISLQFRRWKRRTVKTGGTLLTAVGQLAIEEVAPVELECITEDEARAAGFDDLASLLPTLERPGGGHVYRIRLSLLGPDPRVALRNRAPTPEEVAEIRVRMKRLDASSRSGARTMRTLRVISQRPGARAADLAEAVGVEQARFKANVRKLKALGLTESMEVGYRLSSRGASILERIAEVPGADGA